MSVSTAVLLVTLLLLSSIPLLGTAPSDRPTALGSDSGTPLFGSLANSPHPRFASPRTSSSASLGPRGGQSFYGTPTGSTWANISGTFSSAPPGRGGIAGQLVYDPVNGSDLLFGGWNETRGALNDTWILSDNRWSQVHSVSSPTAYTLASVAWDVSDDYGVLFGGFDTAAARLNETWAFRNDSWVQLRPVQSPSARVGSSLTWDPTIGCLVLFGGSTNVGPVNDTWTFVHGNWTQLAPASAPPARLEAAMTFDANVSSVVLFGGSNPDLSGGVTYNDTWRFSNGTWAAVAAAVSPPSQSSASMVNFAPLRSTLLFGGDPGGIPGNQTWWFDGGNWHKSSLPLGPPALGGIALAAGPFGSILCFGGYQSTIYTRNFTWVYYSLNLTVTAGSLRGETPFSAAFNATTYSGAPPVAVNWTLGDGTIASGDVVTHVYAAGGNYSINVHATDGLGLTSESNFTIQVFPGLLVSALAAPREGTAPLAVTFSASAEAGEPPYTFAWTATTGVALTHPTISYTYPAFGTYIESQSVNYTYSTAGTYLATLTVNDSFGVVVDRNFTIVVQPPIVPPPELTGSLAVSPNLPEVLQSITFAATAAGGIPGYSYSWAGLPDGCSSANSSTISCTPTDFGRFVVNATVHDSANEVTLASAAVVIAPKPNASISATSVGGCGSPMEWGFTVDTVGGWPEYEYTWSFSDGQSSSGAFDSSIEHVFGVAARGPVAYANVTVTDATGSVVRASYLANLATSCPAQPAQTASSLPVLEGLGIAAVGLIAAALIVWTGRRKRA